MVMSIEMHCLFNEEMLQMSRGQMVDVLEEVLPHIELSCPRLHKVFEKSV